METSSPDELKRLNKFYRDEENIKKLAHQIRPLHTRMVEVAKEKGISKQTALREAIFIWLHKEEDGADRSRYDALRSDFSDVLAVVRNMLEATSIEELREKIDYVLENYG